jgi:predicted TIM-barrel fold metal-dependent hydrolase
MALDNEQVVRKATDAARWIETAPISENDCRKICYGNAAALFGLPR